MKTTTKLRLLAFLASLFLLNSANIQAQVTGNANLSGQTNHSGIKVKFIPNSPTAHLDSAFTTATGSYSINLAGGLYQVLLSKTGYQSTYLNNGNAFAIATTATLSNATLQPGNTVIVSGNVSGNWSVTNTYIVNGNITIPSGSSLNIGPGTVIKFNGNYSLIANGTLTANGTSTAPVVFTSNLATPAPGNWDKIEIKNSASSLNHCLIEYGNTPVYASNYNISLTNSEIRNFDFFGIYNVGGSSVISGNKIHEFKGSGIFAGGSGSTTTVSCNEIYNGGGINPALSGNGYGIITNGKNIVRNNFISNMGGPNAIGISVHADGNPTIQNNFIKNCRTGIAVGNSVTPAPNPLIINNTITNSAFAGIDFNAGYANGKVINNIVVNSNIGINQQSSSCSICTTTPDIVAFNLVWNNSNGNYANVQKAGIGQIVTNNANGSAIDSYYNLSEDPLFTTVPTLSSNSPAINAGDPTYSPSIGFSAPASCQLSILSAPKEVTETGISLKSYPNPFSESLNIAYSVPGNTQVTIELFDLAGRSQGTLLNEFKTKGEYQFSYNGSHVKPGMYILKLTTKGSKSTHQIVIKN